MDETQVCLLIKSLDNLKALIDQLKDEKIERVNIQVFDEETFWTNLHDTCTAISHDCTKVSLAFSKPPYPDNATLELFLTSLEMLCLRIVSIFYGFPKTRGLTLRKQLRITIINLVESINRQISTIKENELPKMNHATGEIWEITEKLKMLPRNNKELVLKLVKNDSELIKDALKEMEDEIDNFGDSQVDSDEEFDDDFSCQKWSISELEICKSAIGLIKTAHACTRKVASFLSESDDEYINEFDEIFSKAENISPCVDDFVASLYPAICLEVLKSNAVTVSEKLKSLLSTITDSKLQNADKSWVDFLTKAIEHNFIKIENLSSSST